MSQKNNRPSRGQGQGTDIGGDYQSSYGGGGGQFQERKPLDWTPCHQIQSGNVLLEVSTARAGRGPLYSFSLCRMNGPDKKSKHIRESDIDDVIKAAEDLKFWLQADRHENSAG